MSWKMKMKNAWLKSRLSALDRKTEVQQRKKLFVDEEFKYQFWTSGNVQTN